MTVWTVSSTDDIMSEPLGHCLTGSYTSRGKALDACVDYIIERLGMRDDLAYSMAHDEEHKDASQFFSRRRADGLTQIKRGMLRRLKEYLRDEIGGQGCYYVFDGEASWHFDVDENDVEGELWQTVTWGDSDREDPEFTTPWPETFASQETAVKTFVDYVRDLFKAHGLKFGDDDAAFIRSRLAEDGKVQVDLGDGCCVSCVLYHDDAKNIKE